ncbi:MAG: PEGA domain-containing protein [Lachnospiraceae bacterium]|nr:PEGA domain-containing protein [Lachnospiraceae bacterium]
MKQKTLFGILFLLILLLTGCGNEEDTAYMQSISDNEPAAAAVPAADPMMADSLDHAVIRLVDQEDQKILFYSLKANRSYLLAFNSATAIRDRFGEELVSAQLTGGDIVNVAFLKNEKEAKGIWLDDTVQRLENVTDFSVNTVARTMEIGQDQYSIGKDCIVLFQGKELTLSDINESDTLSVVCSDNTVLSLAITRGHGYVRLIGADPFEGGWVEFGQDVIRQVEKDSLYVVPEGTYQMVISKGHDFGTKDIEVKANEELEVDVSDVLTDADRTGQILFSVTPVDATLTVDDKQMDFSKPIELTYGIHQVVVSAEGYQKVTRYIKVGEPLANLSIELEKEKEEQTDQTQVGAPSVSENTPVVSASEDGSRRVYIDGPSLAELYVDDVYIGVIPTSFAKKSGKHTISLRREGYINRSYTLEIDDGDNDNHYSFSSLKPATTAADATSLSGLSQMVTDALSGL